MPREPGEQPKDDSTKEEREQQRRQEQYQRDQGEKAKDKYWDRGPS